jgi:hypothetical protein
MGTTKWLCPFATERCHERRSIAFTRGAKCGNRTLDLFQVGRREVHRRRAERLSEAVALACTEGNGTMSSPRDSTHAIANCATAAPFAIATWRRASTS